MDHEDLKLQMKRALSAAFDEQVARRFSIYATGDHNNYTPSEFHKRITQLIQRYQEAYTIIDGV